MKRSDIKSRPLADTVLAALEPEEKEYREADVGGLYLRVKPSGVKSWALRYKRGETWAWVTIGRYPLLGAADARRKAAELLEAAEKGEDISKAGRVRAQALAAAETATFESLAGEWFAARRNAWQQDTAARVWSSLELHVFPSMGKRPFKEIHPTEWMALFKGMEGKGILHQLGKVRRYCKEIYDLARVTGRMIANPVDGLEKFLQSSSSTNFSHVGITELPQLIRDVRAYEGAPDVRIGLQLLMLTAVRSGELRKARWCELKLNEALWVIPGERMKKRREHVVPLSRQALTLLDELCIYTGRAKLMFPGRSDVKKPRSDMVFNMALRHIGYDNRQTGHGFRHIASTVLRESGFTRDHVEAQLSHAEGGVAGVYNKAIYLRQRREMMQWYADYLDDLASGAVEGFGVADRA